MRAGASLPQACSQAMRTGASLACLAASSQIRTPAAMAAPVLGDNDMKSFGCDLAARPRFHLLADSTQTGCVHTC
jgi:hypothetical protein